MQEGLLQVSFHRLNDKYVPMTRQSDIVKLGSSTTRIFHLPVLTADAPIAGIQIVIS